MTAMDKRIAAGMLVRRQCEREWELQSIAHVLVGRCEGSLDEFDRLMAESGDPQITDLMRRTSELLLEAEIEAVLQEQVVAGEGRWVWEDGQLLFAENDRAGAPN